MSCLDFKKFQPLYAYKLSAYKNKKVYFIRMGLVFLKTKRSKITIF